MPAARIVGRDTELDALRHLPRALVLEGGPGIGKTTLWQAGVEHARGEGVRVLTARPAEGEARFSFSGLADLLEAVDLQALESIPPPQRRALEVALLRVEPTGLPLESWAIGAGLQAALSELAAPGPLLIAIDDVQWLDGATAGAVEYAARRLAGSDVRFLVAQRAETASGLDAALALQGAVRLDVSGLSLGAIRRLLLDRLGLTLTHRALRRLVDASGGNPLFAIELGRDLASRPKGEHGEDSPVPQAVDELLGARVAHLTPAARALLLAVSMGGDLDVETLERLGGPEALGEAVGSGVLTVERQRARASHPLLAAVARDRSTAPERKEAHEALARVAADAESRIRHLALAAERPDASLAADVAAAAAAAHARAALDAAIELAEHALRLMPQGVAAHDDRQIALADYLIRVGEQVRATDLLGQVGATAAPASRVRAHLLLARASGTVERHEEQLALALALAEDEDLPELRAAVLAEMSALASVCDVTRIPQAEAWALEAESLARGRDADIFRDAICSVAWARLLRGRDVEDLRGPYDSASADQPELYRSLDRLVAIRLGFRGEAEKARRSFGELLALADARGEGPSYDMLRLQLCEAEMRAGCWDTASGILDEWDESPSSEDMAGVRERCRALVAAGRGSPDDAARWAQGAIAGFDAHGQRWELLEGQRARGLGALLAHDLDVAADCLRSVWRHMEREGIEELGAFPVAPDLVECLVELGELDEAAAVAEAVRRRAEEQEHPWGLPTARRCRSLVRLASRTDEDEAVVDLLDAAAAYGKLGLRFDRARTLLVLGRAQRRRRKWAAARSALVDAVAAFDELGSFGWAESARSELERVGARRPAAPGTLTAAEARVVPLAAAGRSNKEIAAELFITVHTVERHLSRAYAKLGVRSRSQLARALETRP